MSRTGKKLDKSGAFAPEPLWCFALCGVQPRDCAPLGSPGGKLPHLNSRSKLILTKTKPIAAGTNFCERNFIVLIVLFYAFQDAAAFAAVSGRMFDNGRKS